MKYLLVETEVQKVNRKILNSEQSDWEYYFCVVRQPLLLCNGLNNYILSLGNATYALYCLLLNESSHKLLHFGKKLFKFAQCCSLCFYSEIINLMLL